MLSHIVVFWLKEDLTVEQTEKFRKNIALLKDIEYAHSVYIGSPAETADRPVIDKSYSFAINAVFKSIGDHDLYQVHPLHKAFLKECVPMCTKVQIYDFE